MRLKVVSIVTYFLSSFNQILFYLRRLRLVGTAVFGVSLLSGVGTRVDCGRTSCTERIGSTRRPRREGKSPRSPSVEVEGSRVCLSPGMRD